MIKVLVCDDDKMITDKVKHLLNDIQEQYSFELNIQIYNDGQSVMKENEVFDIAIVDIEMPNVDGLNYTHENRHSQKWKSDDSTAKMDTAKVNIP